MKKISAIILLAAASTVAADACTSMIVSGRASASGRPLLWKHRDSSGDMNFVEHTAATDSTRAFSALYNGGDSLLLDAWAGVNDAGFAVMNTASYNLAPDTARLCDREGAVMALALGRCATVADFEQLLLSLPRPMGVQANFGVIDALGGAAYFETHDHGFTRFDVDDTPDGVIIRTNYSCSGTPDAGMGYIRYDNACALASDAIAAGAVTPELLTEGLSRSFYHSLLGCDAAADTTVRWVVDQDFIPRRSSVASVVVEGCASGDDPAAAVMWTVIGYPPCGHVVPATASAVPDELRPVLPGFTSPAAQESSRLLRLAFPIARGSGSHYIDMQALRPISDAQRALSLKAYDQYRTTHKPKQ